MTRNDWSQMMQQQQQNQQQQQAPLPQPKQPSNSIWPEKLAKSSPEQKSSRKKTGAVSDSEYSEEYPEQDDVQSEGDEVTTTEAPRKVRRTFFVGHR